jgi:phosphopantothenoylcysteine decarboxylase/phosphopantothenate--cysteine ligase
VQAGQSNRAGKALVPGARAVYDCAMGLLANKRILLGLAGGIAAYKGPELVRRLRDAGAEVRVAMTSAAARFVSKLSLEVVSTFPVADDLWRTDDSRIVHTDLARDSDLVILAPTVD